MTAPPADGPVLVYDAGCGLCAGSVRFVLAHDRAGTLRFAALDGEFGRALRARHPGLESVESVIWVESAPHGAGERILLRSDAAIRAARYLGGGWRVAELARIIPRAWRDAVYRTVARHRHHLGQGDPCQVPNAEERARFLP